MQVAFKRTGLRRYAVTMVVPGEPARMADPAPGYDPDLPHDLVHYVVEAELGLSHGVYGRAARGAGTFVAAAADGAHRRMRSRQQRRQGRRERALRDRGGLAATEMATSERLAAASDVLWRRRAGQCPDPDRVAPALGPDEHATAERIVARLSVLAPLWRALPVGGALVFQWPALEPSLAVRDPNI